MTPVRVVYDAVVRPDTEAGQGYLAVSTTRYIGTVIVTDWEWTGYGDTPEAALAGLERRLAELHQVPCHPCRIVYDLDRPV